MNIVANWLDDFSLNNPTSNLAAQYPWQSDTTFARLNLLQFWSYSVSETHRWTQSIRPQQSRAQFSSRSDLKQVLLWRPVASKSKGVVTHGPVEQRGGKNKLKQGLRRWTAQAINFQEETYLWCSRLRRRTAWRMFSFRRRTWHWTARRLDIPDSQLSCSGSLLVADQNAWMPVLEVLPNLCSSLGGLIEGWTMFC